MTFNASKVNVSKVLLTLVMFAAFTASARSEQVVDFASAIAEKKQEIEATGQLEVAGQTIYGLPFVRDLYLLNGQAPLWNEDNLDELVSALNGLRGDGLNPDDYLLPEARRFLDGAPLAGLSPSERLELDILLTEGLIRALYNLAFGKVDAEDLDPNINFARPLEETELAPILVEHAARRDVEGLLALARPERASYGRLKQGLQQYRDLQAQGGWPTLPEGAALKPGASDARVPLLAERLTISGDYGGSISTADPELFDADLVDALKRFQTRHGLEADGVMGAGTLRELNAPVEQRINQIRVNLERQRWYAPAIDNEREFIVVDIAGFRVYWFKDGAPVWSRPVQVGRAYTKTPVFSDEIQYIDFNPTWTIPPGILRRSVIPGLKKDPDYLDQKGYQLLTLKGDRVDPTTVDWANLKGFPYMVRQPPGPNNALGLVKFMFPNPHFVFLHDTNARQLFGRTQRTFSSGCVRVKDPFDLAERLLQDQGWDRTRIDSVIASGQTTRVNLDEPMPIIIAYGTALDMGDGVGFRPDIYERDAKVLAALDAPFSVRKRDR